MNKIDRAIIFAVRAHEGQKRKGKDVPYIFHVLDAAKIVSWYTSDEDIIAAAVLHDVVEDTRFTLADISCEFGKRVADLVAAETAKKFSGVGAWRKNRENTVEKLKYADRDVRLVCLGDKLANMREIHDDYLAIGYKLWDRFNASREDYEWYYGAVLSILEIEFCEDRYGPIDEYRKLYDEVFGN